MEIKIKTLTLSNFRGIEKFRLENLGKTTNIHGRNGAGKTTLYDAFTWLLFGKDHEGRTDHELKPRSIVGEQAKRTQVSVACDLVIDGKDVKLERVYREKWRKPRGESEEVFDGNTTDYRINDVEVSMTDYNAKVKSLCEENVFKSVTNTHYFTSLDKAEQRKILFALIPDVTDEQIASKREDFKTLLNEITGVSFEAFKKEISAKKKPLNDVLKSIPIEIETTKSNMPVSENWEELEKELTEKKNQIKDIEAQLSDIATRSRTQNDSILEIQAKINELDKDNRSLERLEKEMRDEDVERKSSEVRKLTMSIGDDERDYKTKKFRLNFLNSDKEFYAKKLADLRKEWTDVSLEQVEIDDSLFVCPTCKRLFEESDVEAKKEEVISNFNKQKAERLAKNKEQGIKISVQLETIEEEVARLNLPGEPDTSEKQAQIEVLKSEIEVIKNKQSSFMNSPVFLANIQKMDEYRAQINDLRNSFGINNVELVASKNGLRDSSDLLKKRLYNKDIINDLQKQVVSLEERKKASNYELAELERKEFLIKEFEYAKNGEYEQRINMLFEFVQFRLFKQQVDGTIIPDCEAMMNGTLYSTLSNAEKIYAGLDIIRTISSNNSIVAPIFIDNRESTTNIPEMDAQIINLFVNPEYEQLTIK
ncbi:MAG: AAA family ATPase [Bacteroidaceae bacterium]